MRLTAQGRGGSRRARFDQREGTQHLVGLDHQGFVAAKAGLRKQKVRLAGETDLRSDARRLIGFVAAAAEAAAHPFQAGIEHRFDRIVDAAEIGGLDLREIRRRGVRESLYVFERVAPLVNNDLDFAALPRAERNARKASI